MRGSDRITGFLKFLSLLNNPFSAFDWFQFNFNRLSDPAWLI